MKPGTLQSHIKELHFKTARVMNAKRVDDSDIDHLLTTFKEVHETLGRDYMQNPLQQQFFR